MVGWVSGISNSVGYLLPNSVYVYILNIYDLKTNSLLGKF